MAFFDTTPFAPSMMDRVSKLVENGTRALSELFETPFDKRNRRLARRIEALRGLTDDQLRVLGITRDEIIPYVFGQVRSSGSKKQRKA